MCREFIELTISDVFNILLNSKFKGGAHDAQINPANYVAIHSENIGGGVGPKLACGWYSHKY